MFNDPINGGLTKGNEQLIELMLILTLEKTVFDLLGHLFRFCLTGFYDVLGIGFPRDLSVDGFGFNGSDGFYCLGRGWSL